jgi:hypothetical protein
MRSERRRKPPVVRLKISLEEAIRHARGEITLKTTTVELPDEPPGIDAATRASKTERTTLLPDPRREHQ